MAKDKSEKREKKEKKEKHSEADGVSKKSKKEKKEKKSKELPADVTTALLNQLEAEKPGSVAIDADGDVVVADAEPNGTATAEEDAEKKKVAVVIPKDALVPFANPLVDEKTAKKLFKGIKKAAKNKTLKRGVKEVVKSLRKSPIDAPASSGASNPPGIVVLAADISPMDVISHIPVLCEDHNIPYLYVTSRAELGAAGNTKRPTSVVMIARERQGKKKEEETEEENYEEAYADLVKVAEKAGRSVRI